MPVELRKLETIYQGYSTLMRATLTGPDGRSFQREIEHHGHAAAVLPYDPSGRTALVVSLPRAPVIWCDGPPELLEAVAGMIEAEPPEACVRREALEEAGVRLEALEPVATCYASPGVSSERTHLFLAPYALADRVADGGGADGEHEHITVVEAPLAELWAWIDEGRVEDLKTLTLAFALRLRLPELFGGA